MPLVSFPDAAEQRGRVVVASDGVELPTIVAERMQPTPLPSNAADVHAVYRYQPARFYDAGPAPAVWLGPSADGTSGAKLVATTVRIESHYTPDGAGAHRIAYRLENQGATNLELHFPRGVKVQSAQLDGQSVVDAVHRTQADRVALALSPQRRFVLLELQLESGQQPLTAGQQLPSPLPAGPLTILRGEWTIWLPQEFAMIGDAVSPVNGEFEWRDRLFGPLARQRTGRPFNPLDGRDWNTLWASLNFSTAKAALAAAAAKHFAAPAEWMARLPNRLHRRVAGCGHDCTSTGDRCLVVGDLSRCFGWHVARWPADGARRSVRPHGRRDQSIASGDDRAAGHRGRARTVAVADLAMGSTRIRRRSEDARGAGDRSNPRIVEHLRTASSPRDRTRAGASRCQRQTDRHEILRRRAVPPTAAAGLAAIRRADRSWLIVNMRCDGELVKQPDTPGVEAGEWTLTCEMETFSRDTTIELPLVEQEARWPTAALVDGIPTPIVWDAIGQACVDTQSPSRAAFGCRFPSAPHDSEQWSAAREFEPAAGRKRRLEANILPAARRLEHRGGYPNERRRAADADHLAGGTRWFGSIDRQLDRSARLDDGRSKSRRVDELDWLRIGPDGLELDAKFVLRSGDWPATLAVRVDHRWELVVDEHTTAKYTVEALPNGQQLLRFDVPPAKRSQRDFPLRFRSRDASPLGRLRVPTLGLVSLPVESSRLALSWDPSLDCEPSPAAVSATVATGDFAAAWGESETSAPPQLLFDAAKLGPATTIAVRPRLVESTYRELLSLTAHTQRLNVVYQADVTPAGAGRFGWSLAVPTDLAIESVVAEIAGQPVLLDWIRAAPDRLNVFFTHAVNDSYRLQLNGTVPLNTAEALTSSADHGCRPPARGANRGALPRRRRAGRVEPAGPASAGGRRWFRDPTGRC